MYRRFLLKTYLLYTRVLLPFLHPLIVIPSVDRNSLTQCVNEYIFWFLNILHLCIAENVLSSGWVTKEDKGRQKTFLFSQGKT